MSDVTILRADRWCDVETGEVRSPAVVVVDGNQIVAVNPKASELPSPAAELDLGDVTLLPGLMDMELNMLIGGPGRPGRPARPDARREGLARLPDPARRGELRHHAHGRLHHRAQPRPDGLHGGVRARCRPDEGRRQRLVPGPADLPGGPRHHPDRGPPRPDDVPGAGAGDHAPERGAGDRQRGGRGAQGGALPDQVRGQAHQDLGVGRRHVVLQRGRLPAVLRRGAGGHRRTRRTATACAWRRTRTATPASGPASGRGWTA